MSYFYNFNFDEDKMYGMPIADMSDVCYGKRKIRINKEDDTIPRTTNPYTCGHVYYKVHEFPACVYKRSFWLEERDDKLAEEIRVRYLEAREKKKEEIKTKTLTIKEIFDICKDYDVCVDLSYLDKQYGQYRYVIKFYYGIKRSYDLLDSSEFESILADRESFVKYICDFLEKANEKEDKDESF